MRSLKAWFAAVGISNTEMGHGKVLRWRDFALVRFQHIASLYRRIELAEARLIGLNTINSGESGSRSGNGRSVVFLNNSYYNFLYLAAALRKRGWDAISVSYDDPNGPNANFLHGADVWLFDPDREEMTRKIAAFMEEELGRFEMVHFYGRGHMGFFPWEHDSGPPYTRLPVDFLRLKQSGVKIGYSVCGCLDGVSQSAVQAWSGCCNRCVWQDTPSVCSDRGNLGWGHKIEMFCDVICCEGFPGLDYQSGPRAYREPLTTALDPEFWRPDLLIPPEHKIARDGDELIIYHAVGNYDSRATKGRNLKGTPAVGAAVERLKSEGVKARLVFVTDLRNTDVRFIQAQADIIVDQLNYGRYGATAREGMMLGKPTVCYMQREEPPGQRRLQSIESCPLVSASEATIYEVLRGLLDENTRRSIGEASRAYAMKWHAADVCAERFEQMYDRLQLSLSPEETVAA